MPNPIPFAPPPWQLSHLLSLKLGERALLVVPLSRQPPAGFSYRPRVVFRAWRLENSAGGVSIAGVCPLGIVGSVIVIEGVGDFRNAGVDLRRTDSMTEAEAVAWLADDGTLRDANVGVLEYRIRKTWNQDHPAQPWGAWAWFVGAEKLAL